jgi:hypothetical protein
MIVADHFVPFDSAALKPLFFDKSVASEMHFCTGDERFDSLPAGAVVLLFVSDDSRNSYSRNVVEVLGRMYSTWDKLSIYILGNLITSDNEAYNLASFREVAALLFKQGCIPIVVASSTIYQAALFEARMLQGVPSLSIITSSLNEYLPNGAKSSWGEVKRFVLSSRGGVAFLGIQGYFSAASAEKQLEKHYLQVARLGSLRGAMHLAEPLLRDSSLLFVDLSSVKRSDFDSGISPTPNGLYAEELCQLMRYAGYSDGMEGVCIGGFNEQQLSGNVVDCILVAQAAWHIFEGIASRRNERPGITAFASKEFYIELGEQEPLTLNFLQSQNTGRWWLFVPSQNGEGRWVSCDAEDYEAAKHHELPFRWIALFKVID